MSKASKEALVKSAPRRTIGSVAVNDARILAGHSTQTFAGRLGSAKPTAARRRGEFVWPVSIAAAGWPRISA